MSRQASGRLTFIDQHYKRHKRVEIDVDHLNSPIEPSSTANGVEMINMFFHLQKCSRESV